MSLAEKNTSRNHSSRETILKAIQSNQPDFISAPSVPNFIPSFDDRVQKFIDVITGIGARVYLVDDFSEVINQLTIDLLHNTRVVSFDGRFQSIAEIPKPGYQLHQFEDVDVFILSPGLAVAENGAIWVTENELSERVLPFIAQSLVAVLYSNNIVATMHDAYDIISDKEYGFATFISGPSKTADIEQSLVLGAHGPKAMTVFIINVS